MKRLFFIVICAFFFIPSLSHGATVGKATLSGRVPTNGLIGYWTFDGGDVVNGMIRDKSGQGNNGNTSGIASSSFYTFGKIGQAGNFDGVNDMVTLSGVSVGTTHTVSMWIFPIPSSDSYGTLFAANTTSGIYYLGNLRKISYYYGGDHLNTTALIENKWNHVVVSTNAGTATFYINGVADGTASGATGYTANRIGDDSGSETYRGSIDDVRVYNRALSAAEITALYNSSARGAVSGISPDKARVANGGLVAHWTFDGKDMVNGMVRDTSGQENKAYTSGIASSTFFTTGKQGQGLTFDGTNDYLSTTNVLNLAKVTVSAWIKISAIPSTVMDIAHFANGHNSFLHDKVLYIDTAGKARFYVYDGGPKYTSVPSNALPLNTWVHLVGTADGTTATMYVDGVSVGSVAAGDTYTGYNVANFFMGPIAYSSTYIAFRGSMDDVRIYNRALSASEVSALYSSTRGTVTATSPTTKLASGLVGYWTFDGKNITNGRINDVSGNGNNGNTSGIASSSFYTFGKIGQGGNFDGVNDYVTTQGQATIEGQSAATVSMWAKSNSSDPVSQGLFTAIVSNNTYVLGYEIAGNGGYIVRCTNNSGTSCQIALGDYSVFRNSPGWHLITITFDGASHYYEDGRLISSSAVVGGTLQTGGSSEYFDIGSGAGPYWGGSIDDVRVYNRALSVSEIQQLYNMGR